MKCLHSTEACHLCQDVRLEGFKGCLRKGKDGFTSHHWTLRLQKKRVRPTGRGNRICKTKKPEQSSYVVWWLMSRGWWRPGVLCWGKSRISFWIAMRSKTSGPWNLQRIFHVPYRSYRRCFYGILLPIEKEHLHCREGESPKPSLGYKRPTASCLEANSTTALHFLPTTRFNTVPN